jgi:uncharacterized membrane protein YkvA (DUF1232 family)
MTGDQMRSPLSGAERLADPGMVGEARLAWRLLRDPRVSWLKMAIPVFAALYVASPIDPIPDFLLGIGQVDDLGVVIALTLATIRLLPRLSPQHVVAEHRADLAGDGSDRPPPDGAASNGPVYDGAFHVREPAVSNDEMRGNR